MTNQEFAELFKRKTKELAVDTIKYLSQLPNSTTLSIDSSSILKTLQSTSLEIVSVLGKTRKNTKKS